MKIESSTPTEQQQSSPVELCTVRAEATHFGVPIGHIVEIVGGMRPLPVPLAPGFVGGLAHYRGDVLTTVCLRRLLGMAFTAEPQQMLVLEGAGGCFGLQVDAAGEVLTVPAGSFETMPSTLNECASELFAGALKLPNRLLILLHPDQLDPMRLSARLGG